jgi:molybdenum cofactor biosynthesis enzyme MoaA
MIVARTTALCNACDSSHEATVVRRDDCIVAQVDCPEGISEFPVSSDADLFLKLRKRSMVDPGEEPPDNPRFVLNYISITNACNFDCAICGAKAISESRGAVFLPAAEIFRRAEQVKRDGGRLLHLIGGEPTLHPDLLSIVQRLSRMGFSVGLATNGYLLGKDKTLARRLKANGLNRICLQFDSFEKDVLRRLDRNHLEEKLRAIQSAVDAGLELGLNATVTRHNISELSALLEHGLELGPSVVNMTFASAAPIGRYRFAPEDSVDRERMVMELLKASAEYELSLDDVLPLPSFGPWRLQVHPDCGVHIVFLRTPGGIRPLNHYVDLWEVYRRMHQSPRRSSIFSRTFIPIAYLARAIRKGRLWATLKVALALLFSRTGYGTVNVGVSNYHGAMFLDEQRIARCASAFYTSIGPVRGCLHFFRDARYPGSREYEVRHGGC